MVLDCRYIGHLRACRDNAERDTVFRIGGNKKTAIPGWGRAVSRPVVPPHFIAWRTCDALFRTAHRRAMRRLDNGSRLAFRPPVATYWAGWPFGARLRGLFRRIVDTASQQPRLSGSFAPGTRPPRRLGVSGLSLRYQSMREIVKSAKRVCERITTPPGECAWRDRRPQVFARSTTAVRPSESHHQPRMPSQYSGSAIRWRRITAPLRADAMSGRSSPSSRPPRRSSD